MDKAVSVPRVRRWYQRVGYPMEIFDPSVTKQSFVSEADINGIVKRYKATGLIRQLPGQPMYLDCTTLPVDYQDALNKVVAAKAAFQRVSSDVRAQFNNDAARFVEFAADPKNIDQMREWKLAPMPEKARATLDDLVDAVKASKALSEGDRAPGSSGEAKPRLL